MSRGRKRGVLGTLFRYEMKMLLRDTRTILIAVVAPIVLFPAYILILNFVEEREQRALEEETYSYAVVGSRAEWASDLVDAAIARDRADPDTSRSPVVFERREEPSPLEALSEGDLHVVVEGLSAAEWDSVQEEEEGAVEGEATDEADTTPANATGKSARMDEAVSGSARIDEGQNPRVPVIRLHYRGESDFSREARNRLTERILEVRAARRDSVYRSAGFPVAMENVAIVEAESVATAAKEAGAFLGVALMPFLVLLMLSGGSIVAVDAISGEKERGTLETLLTTAASRTEIVRAKLLAVIVVGLSVAVINIANLLVYLVVGLLDLPANFAVEVSPLDLVLLLALFVPVAVLVAATLLLLSGAAKSYKEYQVYFFPVFLIFLLPCAAPALPGIDLRSVIAVVPLAGVAVAVREILIGEIDMPFVILAFLTTGGMAAWLTRLTQDTLSNEKLISGSDLDAADLTGGPALFPRHVLRWYLFLWVVFFVVSLWFGQELGIRGQVLVNMVGIFLGGSLIMIRRYGLNLRQAFGLRMPHPGAWLAVLIGAPSALVLGVGVSQLVNTYVFPVPEQILESFGQALLGPDLPLWQLVFFLTVMPGIFEELFFRGVLVHGLRPRIRNPWLLALAVGIIFGFFHVSLFRIVPTAWLGFVLTGVVLLTGSVYPAMLWHALNNVLGIVPQSLGWLPEDFAPEAWWSLPAAVGLGVAFWILWRGRGRGGGPGAQGHGARSGPGPSGVSAETRVP